MIKTIPVVMANSGDAVRRGIVADLARPGGNITGLTSIGFELYGKRLELLKEIVPTLSRVGFLWSPTNPEADPSLNETETVARSLRLGIQPIEVRGPADFEGAFRAATKKRAEALMVIGRRVFRLSLQTDRRASGKESTSNDVWQHAVCRGRWTDDLRI